MTPPGVVRRLVRPLLPRRVRPRRILGGPLRGRHIIASWHDYPAALLGYTEGPLLRWLAATVNRGDTWLDVGAHYGYTALALARLVGPAGRVFAFEPIQDTARCLSDTCVLNGLPQVQVVPLGLANCAQVTSMEVAVRRGMAEPHPNSEQARDQISVVSLDRIWSRLSQGDERVQGLKVDVQGMELPALQGMATLLGTRHPLLAIEFHRGVDRHAVLRLLDGCGYRTRGTPLAPLADETEPQYADDHTYVFSAVSEVC